jgi:hypothetical protein
MMLTFWNGINSVIVRFKLRDTTLSNNGGKTGLSNTSTGLIISTISDVEATATAYTSAGSTIDTIATLGTFATPTNGHCRFQQVDSTNHPGLYEIQIANARWAVSGARALYITVSGVSGVTQEDGVVQLPTVNLADGTNSASPAVPNAASGANGGLPVLSSGAVPASVSSMGSNVLTAAAIASGALNGKGDWLLSSGYTAPPTVAAIASAIWQDLVTGGDFSVTNSIGKYLSGLSVGGGGGGGGVVTGYAQGLDPATMVLEALQSAHDNPGTIGAVINSIEQFNATALANLLAPLLEASLRSYLSTLGVVPTQVVKAWRV